MARPSRPPAAAKRPSAGRAVIAADVTADGDAALTEPATLVIRGLAARTFIGITDEERSKRQDVLVDVTLDVSTRAGRTDRIQDAVDYKAIKDAVLAYVEGTRHHLLEALAQGIADRCLGHAGVEAVEVEVDKPGALRFARSVAVRIRRERQAEASPASGKPRARGTAVRNWGHRG